MTRVCATCKVEKSLTEDFYRDATAKHGRSHYCKACNRIKVAAWAKANPEKVLKRARRAELKKFYRMTPEQYNAMLVRQCGLCAICQKPPTGGKSLCVDHDHGCCPTARTCGNCIRGLLCSNCNRALGGFGDNKSVLLGAVLYLQRSE